MLAEKDKQASTPWIDFQTGEYPIKQVIFCNMDSVTGSLFTPLLRNWRSARDSLFDQVDIVHFLRESSDQPDLDVLLRTTSNIVTACWTEARARAVLPDYQAARGWPDDSVRIYVLTSPKITCAAGVVRSHSDSPKR
jgi:hypothetical protein